MEEIMYKQETVRTEDIEAPFNLEEISELFPGIFPLEVMPEFLSSVNREIMKHIEKSIDPNKSENNSQ